MIQLENISKTYHTARGEILALADISLTVQRGEIFGVIGKSGAGKSTLIRCINLLERPDRGSVRVNQQEVTALSAKALRQLRHKIGMIFQEFNLLATRTVYQNISFPLELIGKNKKEIQQIIMPLIELTGLTEKIHVYPSQLSGGQKQRVAIARALATQPDVLLCDEMTSALDPETTSSILQLIKDIHQQFNLSVFLITHEMEVIKAIANRVAVIDHGKIIEQNDVVNLFKNPQTEIAKKFTQSAIRVSIPENLVNKLHKTPISNAYALLRLDFIGKTVAEPIIHGLIKHFNIQVNILEAHVEVLRNETIGAMIIAVLADAAELHRGMAYLIEKGLQVEVLGYVEQHDWTNH